jgi:hypothetical protein
MYGSLQVESGGIFNIIKSLGSTLGDVLSNDIASIPIIIIWQVAILLSLAAVTTRSD